MKSNNGIDEEIEKIIRAWEEGNNLNPMFCHVNSIKSLIGKQLLGELETMSHCHVCVDGVEHDWNDGFVHIKDIKRLFKDVLNIEGE